MICYRAEATKRLPPIAARAEVEEIAWLDMRYRDRCAPAVQTVLTELCGRGLIR